MTQETFADLGALYAHIQECIAHVLVFENGEKISDGTGFALNAEGHLLTAAHVVAGGFPIRRGEVDDPSRQVLVMFVEQGEQLLYRPIICPFQIESAGLTPHQLDVAMLLPVERPSKALKHFAASVNPPKLGEEMYFGGYSDEVEFPFGVDRHILPHTAGLDDYKRAIGTGIKARIGGPIIKRGTVGNVIEAHAMRDDKLVLKQTAFYLDNQIHYGVVAEAARPHCPDVTVEAVDPLLDGENQS